MQYKIPAVLAISVIAVLFSISFAETFPLSDSSVGTTSSSSIFMQGTYTFTVYDVFGEVKSIQQQTNLVVNDGMECTGDFLFGTTVCTGEAVMQHIALGTTGGATLDTSSALTAESGTCLRVTDASPSMAVGVDGERPVTILVNFAGGTCEGIAFAEVGLFDDASTGSGNMLSRSPISPTITLGVGDSLDVNYEVDINNT